MKYFILKLFSQFSVCVLIIKERDLNPLNYVFHVPAPAEDEMDRRQLERRHRTSFRTTLVHEWRIRRQKQRQPHAGVQQKI